METSGDTGRGDELATVSSSAAISEPSCNGDALRPEEQFRRPQHVWVVAGVERCCAGSRGRAGSRTTAGCARRRCAPARDRPPRRCGAGSDDRGTPSITSQFSRASASAMAAMSAARHWPARIGQQRRVRACARPSQASGGGLSSGRARYALRKSSVTTSPPPASRSSRWCPQESQKSRHRASALVPAAIRSLRLWRPSPGARGRTGSPGSSSPSTSRNENARIGLRSSRGCSVRNASRISPSSNRAMHRDQRVGRMVAERRRESHFLLGRSAGGGEVGRAEIGRQAAAPTCRPALARSASVASTICTSVDQPNDCTPRGSRCGTRRARLP